MQTFHKVDIAEEYLDVAGEMYLAGRFWPAIHLAGAAWEIFDTALAEKQDAEIESKKTSDDTEARLRFVRHKPPILDEVADQLVEAFGVMGRQTTRGEIINILRLPQNNAKHAMRHEKGNKKIYNLTIEIDPATSALVLIFLAVQSSTRLMRTFPHHVAALIAKGMKPGKPNHPAPAGASARPRKKKPT